MYETHFQKESQKDFKKFVFKRRYTTIVSHLLNFYFYFYFFIKYGSKLGDCVEKKVVNPVRQKDQDKVSHMIECSEALEAKGPR